MVTSPIEAGLTTDSIMFSSVTGVETLASSSWYLGIVCRLVALVLVDLRATLSCVKIEHV